MAERLFHDDSSASPAVRIGQMLDDGFKQHRRNCQVMRRALRILEFTAKRGEGRRILIVSVHISQKTNELFECSGIEPAMFFKAIFRTRAKLIETPPSFGHADYGDVEVPSFHHCLQGWKYLFVGEVACG